MNQFALLKYNFRVMMLHNRLLIVFPLIVSQLTVFWLLMTKRFSIDLPAQSIEMITPILGAFLGAHLLSAEYSSRVGALLASRPVNIGKIVILRVLVMLSLVLGLAGLSLLAFYMGLEPFNVTPFILACIPSTLFLTLLALTFATLFRHALAGFGVAALYWAFDLIPGAPLNPYLSLKSLASFYSVLAIPDRQAFMQEWWIAKIALLIGAVLLYFFHSKIVFSLGAPLSLRLRRRAAFCAAALPLLYLFSGAAVKMSYGYSHRGKLAPNDLAWFRYQFASYGPIPMASLFGSDFTSYLGQGANLWRISEGEDTDLMGDNAKHINDLHGILRRHPNSAWSPSAAEAIARLEGHLQKTPDEAIALYRSITERDPKSPYLGYAFRQTALALAEAGRADEAHTAYGELLEKVPDTEFSSEALRFQIEWNRKKGRLPDAIRLAKQWTVSAPLQDRFQAWFKLAEIQKEAGDLKGAKQSATRISTALKEYREALDSKTISLLPNQLNLRDADARKAEALIRELK